MKVMKINQDRSMPKHSNQIKLAPIGISTYSRFNHLRQTIEALQNNTLAKESELYVFSDAPQVGDEEKVQIVRDFLKTVSGFKRLEIIERETNSRTHNNRQGMRMLLENYGKMIFMEEDIVTAPSFLEYMNFALDAYENNPWIFSIAGYCPPIQIPEDYPYDVFLHPRFNAWGLGMWKDRFDKLEMTIPSFVMKKIFLNPVNLYKYSLAGGARVVPLTLNNYLGYSDGLDIRAFSQQFVMNALTVYPTRSLVDNIGVDGSGVHGKKKREYRVSLPQEPFKECSLPVSLVPNREIVKKYYRFKSGSVLNQIILAFWALWIAMKGLFRFVGKRLGFSNNRVYR
jgi:hypothetical protein